MTNEYGIAGHSAPDFRFDVWPANTGGRPLRLADIDEPVVYLYNFQSWCAGCHSHGFPAMKRIKDHFEASGRADRIKFVAVQTVFEGHETNTVEAGLESVQRHGLTDVAIGHDSGHPPTIMADYGTGGTPWTVIIGPRPHRMVLAEGFQIDPEVAIPAIESLLDRLDDPIHPDRAEGAPMRNEQNMNTSTRSSVPNRPDEAELRDRLTPLQYEVTQNGGTERAFTGAYWDTKAAGRYRCIVCDAELFDSDAKFDSGSGWPSFHSEIEPGRVHRETDRSHGMVRVEARCASCDAHLGHVFPDGPRPTGERYCMNSASLRLEPVSASAEPDSAADGQS